MAEQDWTSGVEKKSVTGEQLNLESALRPEQLKQELELEQEEEEVEQG